jgi:phage baseplate assembly protein W
VRTLQISGGDLVVVGGGYATVEGSARLAQDLRMGLGEPLGNDRFHPGWGSRLEDYVGLPLSDATRFEIEQEVGRVVGNYAAVQRDRIERDTAQGVRSRYRTADVLAEVSDVAVASRLDSVSVVVAIRNATGQSTVIAVEADA